MRTYILTMQQIGFHYQSVEGTKRGLHPLNDTAQVYAHQPEKYFREQGGVNIVYPGRTILTSAECSRRSLTREINLLLTPSTVTLKSLLPLRT